MTTNILKQLQKPTLSKTPIITQAIKHIQNQQTQIKKLKTEIQQIAQEIHNNNGELYYPTAKLTNNYPQLETQLKKLKKENQ